MPANTNRDFEMDWCLNQVPIQGIDKDRGVNMSYDPPIPSPIEDSILVTDPDTGKETLQYTNPRIRARFFKPGERDEMVGRAVKDLGGDVVTGWNRSAVFDTSFDVLGRGAYYLQVNGENVPLERFRYLASTGKDVNGNQVWDAAKFVVEWNGPGVFSFVDGILTFTPPLR